MFSTYEFKLMLSNIVYSFRIFLFVSKTVNTKLKVGWQRKLK